MTFWCLLIYNLETNRTMEVTYYVPQLCKLAFNHSCPIDVCTLSSCQRRRVLTSQLEIQTCLVCRMFLSITHTVLKSLELEKNGPWFNFFFLHRHSYFQSESLYFDLPYFKKLGMFPQYCAAHLPFSFLFELLRLELVTFIFHCLFLAFP